jgi:hypothetical protein
MGGFVIDTNGGEKFIPDSPKLSLTGNGLSVLARTGNLPRISKAFIEEKSSTNLVVKLIAALQGFWLVTQCSARWANQLPVTLLELHTFAHCLCTFAVYLLWSEKPLDIQRPVVLTCSPLRQHIAAMWMFSYNDKRRRGYECEIVPPEIEGMILYEPAGKQKSSNTKSNFDDHTTNPGTLASGCGDFVVEMEHNAKHDSVEGTTALRPSDATLMSPSLTVLSIESGTTEPLVPADCDGEVRRLVASGKSSTSGGESGGIGIDFGIDATGDKEGSTACS